MKAPLFAFGLAAVAFAALAAPAAAQDRCFADPQTGRTLCVKSVPPWNPAGAQEPGGLKPDHAAPPQQHGALPPPPPPVP